MNHIIERIKDDKEAAFRQFLEMYTLVEIDESEQQTLPLADYFKEVFDTALDKENEKFEQAGERLVLNNIKNEIPYIVLINELSFLKNKLIHLLLNIQESDGVIFLCHRFDFFENKIAQSYLAHYIESLQSSINLRLASLSDIAEKESIFHYELHLKWLFKLSEAIRLKDPSMAPERDPTQCHFGKWLLSDAKAIISNNSKYNKLVKLHQTLHYLGSKIARHLNKVDENFHISVTYLEKADLTSMEIGAELMLIDNKKMIASAAKDTLTGVLNRSLLDPIFRNQYEIAKATCSSYIFAMCDLDHFKLVNDTYGHVAGDTVLRSFTKLLQENLRASDIIVRYGGEEFVLILPALNYAQGKIVMNKLCNIVQQTAIAHKEHQISLTVSIGLIEINPDLHSEQKGLEYFIHLADEKVYLAKNNGRNRVE